jgi:hypothetical protein
MALMPTESVNRNACAATLFGRSVDAKYLIACPGEKPK